MNKPLPHSSKPGVVVICGPTASGKTGLCLKLAALFDLEVLSADSRQIYRRMDIGTAKPTPEERSRVRHYLVDAADPDEDFTVAHYVENGRKAVREILARNLLPVIAGGTGLYIQGLTSGLADVPGPDAEFRQRMHRLADSREDDWLHRQLQLVDPELAARTEPANKVRIIRALEVYHATGTPLSEIQRRHAFADRPWRLLKFGLLLERQELDRRIDLRTEAMFAAGLVEEVRSLLGSGLSRDCRALKTIGYQEVVRHLQGDLSLQETIELVKRNTRRYARRQMTWFRRDGEINWVDPDREFAKMAELIAKFNDS